MLFPPQRPRFVCRLAMTKWLTSFGILNKFAAEGLKSAEADGFCLVGFQDREVGERDIHATGKFRQADAAFGHHAIEIELDGHGLDGEIVLGFEV